LADYFLSRSWLPWLAPVLILASVISLGAYYETNDDGLFTLLLRGQAAGAPVDDFHLYLHGFSRLWASLYARWPAAPWYGLTLYTLLTGACTLLFAVLDRAARPRLRPAGRALLLGGFYFIALLESVLWFNYVRVPVLLAGAGMLYALQRAADPVPARRRALLVGLAATLLAGLIRPSMALLGLLAVLPVAFWLPASLPGRNAGESAGLLYSAESDEPAAERAVRRAARRVIGWFAVLALAGTLALNLPLADTEARNRRRIDTLLIELNDYHLRRRTPHTAADALALGGTLRWWLVADSTVFNPALFERACRLDGRYYVARVLPGKLAATVIALARDYFPVLLALLALLCRPLPTGGAHRRLQVLHHVGVAVLLLGLGGVLKLPPRLAATLLALFLAGQLVFVLRYGASPGRRACRLVLVLGVPILLLYAAKTAHRVLLLRHEQQVRTAFLMQLRARAGSRLVAAAGLEAALKSLSPFENAGPARVLLLNGWPTLDPAQARYRQQLGGHRELSPTVRQLAADSTVVWLMPAAFVPFYNSYLSKAARLPLRFQLERPFRPAADTALPVPVRPMPVALP
jgi:hypothetical protein